jgi:hypothetical protein
MFILHVKHYFCQEILKVHSLQKRCRVSILLRLLPANYKIFEVPVLVFARASGNAVSAVRPWDRGWSHRWVALATRDWKTILIGRSISYWTHTPCGVHMRGQYEWIRYICYYNIVIHQSRSPSLRSSGRKRRLWDNPFQGGFWLAVEMDA